MHFVYPSGYSIYIPSSSSLLTLHDANCHIKSYAGVRMYTQRILDFRSNNPMDKQNALFEFNILNVQCLEHYDVPCLCAICKLGTIYVGSHTTIIIIQVGTIPP